MQRRGPCPKRMAEEQMFATELDLAGLDDADVDPRSVRWTLSWLPEVRDVLATDRPQTVVVIHVGQARAARWRAELRTPGGRARS